MAPPKYFRPSRVMLTPDPLLPLFRIDHLLRLVEILMLWDGNLAADHSEQCHPTIFLIVFLCQLCRQHRLHALFGVRSLLWHRLL